MYGVKYIQVTKTVCSQRQEADTATTGGFTSDKVELSVSLLHSTKGCSVSRWRSEASLHTLYSTALLVAGTMEWALLAVITVFWIHVFL